MTGLSSQINMNEVAGTQNLHPPTTSTPLILLAGQVLLPSYPLMPTVNIGPRRMSLDVPRSLSPSPTFVSSLEGSSFGAPPSPTLSTQSSVQFATSLALRGNKPDERSGISSLNLLTPSTPDRAIHHRKGSIATFTSSHEGHSSLDETEPDHGDTEFHLHALRRPKSDATSLTVASPSHTHPDSASELFKSHYSDENVPSTSHHTPPEQVSSQTRGRKESDDEQSTSVTKLEILQDEEVDPTPFSFKPYELASLLDPKNLTALQDLDGHPSDGRPGAGEGASQRHDRNSKEAPVPTNADDYHPQPQTAAGGGGARGGDGGKPDPFHAAVFGENVLPQRSTRSLLGLMWLAIKDKVLVLLSIAAVVSLALGLFQDFGTPRTPGEPPVDWVVVGSLNDWQKERQFKVLNEKKEERGVKVIRNGVEHVIDVKEVVVGDIAILEPGEIVPCDGIFLSGHNVKCDESAATGETDAIKKAPYEACLALKKAQSGSSHTDCFIVSGSKVLEGVGRYVVVAVGTKSFNGRIMMALRTDTENTPLQIKLNILAELIAKVGSIAGIILFGSLMIRFFVQLGTGTPARTANQQGMAFVQILIISVTLVVVAVPEGLPLAVTLALAFATKRMTKENLLVRVLGSCETMANASVICTDKTGTLTQNTMAVVAGSIGIHAKFARTNAAEVNESSDVPSGHRDFSIDQSKLNTILPPQLRDLFNAAIAINSTAFEDEDPATKEVVFIGSKTETALLNFAKELQWAHYRSTRDTAEVVQMIPFSSERKAMAVVVKLANGNYRLYIKGASEILTSLPPEIDKNSQENISRTIIFYANQTLRTIAVCYRDFGTWPPPRRASERRWRALACELTLIGIVGIEDPLRDGVREAVADCQKAGVAVKMCTGDNAGIIMEGPIFRQLNDKEMLDIVPRLQVLARSSPEDKKILVEKLRALGEIVCVTGDGTNDGPAAENRTCRFLRNVTAVVVTFVTAVASSSETSVLSAVQLLWINIIMDTFAALALATDPASPALLDRKPDRLSAPLFSVDMYKQIILQSTYQITITLIFHFLGLRILGLEETTTNDTVVQTLVFNFFVFAQVFNSVNSRRLDRKKNIFEGLLRNYYFIVITLIEIVIQVLIVFVGGAAFQVTTITGREWGISLALGVVSIPLGALIRLLPNGPFEKMFIAIRLLPSPEALPTIKPDAEWNLAIELVRDNLATFANLRGGRLRSSEFVGKSRSARLHDERRVPLPSIMTMVPTLIASSIGAGWAPQSHGSLSDPARYDPSKSSAALWEGKFQVHPDTKSDDPILQKWGGRSRSRTSPSPV
ncbi:Ca-transporting ATPase [Melanogaster broomeanus]|nr:Ca-transporting ATPase [Melanogaster broomeanus]